MDIRTRSHSPSQPFRRIWFKNYDDFVWNNERVVSSKYTSYKVTKFASVKRGLLKSKNFGKSLFFTENKDWKLNFFGNFDLGWPGSEIFRKVEVKSIILTYFDYF